METKIIKQETNPFLQREEFLIEFKCEAAPSSSEVISTLKKDEELTVVKKINTSFGRKTFLVELVTYENKEAREKVETIPQKVKKKIEAERKAAEAEAKKKAKEEADAAAKAAEEAKASEEAKGDETESKEEPKEEEKS